MPDTSASAGSNMAFWYSTAATRTVTTTAGKLTIRAKGTSCNGAAHMKVSVDGTQVLDTDVTGAWADYTPATSFAAGAHAFSVELTNDVYQGATCDRNLYVDKLSLGNAATTPVVTPTSTPTAPVVTPTPTAPVVTPTPTAPVATPTPSPVKGTVLFNGALDGGNLNGWFMQQCTPDRTQVLPDPLGVNRKAMRMTVYNSDVAPCTPTENPRAQALSPSIIKEGDDVWFGYSIMVPNDFPTTTAAGDNWVSVASIYGPPFANSGPMTMYFNTTPGVNKFYFRRNATYNFDTPWSMPLVRNRWVDFVIHAKMSRDPSVGFREQFVNTGSGWQQVDENGQKRLMMKTIDASNGGGNNFVKVSLYYRHNMMDKASLWFAGMKLGTSFDAVAPHS
jgi:hypothetical protein